MTEFLAYLKKKQYLCTQIWYVHFFARPKKTTNYGKRNSTIQPESRRLGDLCEINSGGTPSKKVNSYWQDGTIPRVKSEVCKGEFVYSTEEYITEDGYKNSSARLFPIGTTLIALNHERLCRTKESNIG